MGPILVFGHRNPDNDSICSAVAYAHLKNLTDPARVYVPVRLGPVPPETAWAFARFGVELPGEVAHVRTRVRDVMTTDVVSVGPDARVVEVAETLLASRISAVPVIGERGELVGIVSEGDLMRRSETRTDRRRRRGRRSTWHPRSGWP